MKKHRIFIIVLILLGIGCNAFFLLFPSVVIEYHGWLIGLSVVTILVFIEIRKCFQFCWKKVEQHDILQNELNLSRQKIQDYEKSLEVLGPWKERIKKYPKLKKMAEGINLFIQKHPYFWGSRPRDRITEASFLLAPLVDNQNIQEWCGCEEQDMSLYILELAGYLAEELQKTPSHMMKKKRRKIRFSEKRELRTLLYGFIRKMENVNHLAQGYPSGISLVVRVERKEERKIN